MPILPKLSVQAEEAYKGPIEGRLDYVRLDFGENTADFPGLYPDGLPPQWVSAYPEYGKLLDKIASMYGVSADNILLTNGSDEGLFVISHTFIEPGVDSAVVSKPCFVVQPQSLRLAGAKLIEVPVIFDTLAFDLPGIEAVLKTGVKIAMFATPENPTGSTMPSDVVLDWCKKYPDTLFVIDEAYIEFAPREIAQRDELLNVACKLENLVVLRTFSKAWAMAGLRLGIVVGRPEMLDWLRRVRSPFSVNAAAVWTAINMLEHYEQVLANSAQVYARKNALVAALRQRHYHVNDGESNCLLLSLGVNARKACDYFQEHGVLIRNRSASLLPNHLSLEEDKKPADPLWGKVRISAGTQKENDKFLEVLDSFNRNYAVMFDLDGTLVDTTASFDATIDIMVKKYSAIPLADGELNNLRAEGGFNDDWVATHELLRRRGVNMDLKQISLEATEQYLKLAVDHETPYFDDDLLGRTRERHPLFIVTGRTRPEYDPVWGSRLDPLFERVYCLFDVPHGKPKPAPDYLLKVKEDYKITDGVYVGNSVDDMRAAREAGLAAVAVTTTLPREALVNAGAQMVLSSVNQLKQVLCI